MSKGKMTIGKMRWLIFLLGKLKIPMIGYLNPKLMVLNDEMVDVRIKLRRRSKNHLKSMYFGSLAVGADLAAGIHAFYFAENMGKKVNFAFKSMEGQFLKRAETDIHFRMNDGLRVKNIIEEAYSTQERINKMVHVDAVDLNNEIVAQFKMEISVRVKQ